MKFLVDAHLPRRLSHWLRQQGHECLHTLDLPLGNRSSDADLCTLADAGDYIVVSKDADFVQSRLIKGTPQRLPLVATGNIHNNALEKLFNDHHAALIAALESSRFVELGCNTLTLHD